MSHFAENFRYYDTKDIPPGWSLIMVMLLCLYLIPELIFNAKLVDIAGSAENSHDALRGIELFGRAMSGVGLTLLLSDHLIRRRTIQTVAKALRVMLVVGVVVWPLVFFGQKWLIDHVLIDPSSAEQRQQATFSQMLRSGLADNAVQIEGLPEPTDAQQTAAGKTFLTLFGALVYADGLLLASIEARKGEIAKQYVRHRAYNDFDAYYSQYQDLRREVREGYNRYLSTYEAYRQQLLSIDDNVNQLWTEIEAEVDKAWDDYDRTSAALESKSQALADRLGPQIYRHFQNINRCTRPSCIDRHNHQYSQQMERTALGYVEPEYWLIEEKVSLASNVVRTGLLAVLTGGTSLNHQAVDRIQGGDGGWTRRRFNYTDDRYHYQARIRDRLEPRFQQDTGYPGTLTSMREFQHHPATAKQVIGIAARRGIALPASWTFDQRGVFDRSAQDTLRQEIDSAWHTSSDGFPPGLDWASYQRHADVQQVIKERLGDRYIPDTRADWNNAQFGTYLIDPAIDVEAANLVTLIEARTDTFKDGGENEERGKQALRVILVPPISMTLSLALVLMTFVTLPYRLKSIVTFTATSVTLMGIMRSWMVRVILVVAVLAIPAVMGMLSNNPYTKNSPATDYFLTQISEQGNAKTAFALGWALNAQPVLIPVGLSLEQSLGIYRRYQAVEDKLDRWDERIYGHIRNWPGDK